jgi:hypothetical protein
MQRLCGAVFGTYALCVPFFYSVGIIHIEIGFFQRSPCPASKQLTIMTKGALGIEDIE